MKVKKKELLYPIIIMMVIIFCFTFFGCNYNSNNSNNEDVVIDTSTNDEEVSTRVDGIEETISNLEDEIIDDSSGSGDLEYAGQFTGSSKKITISEAGNYSFVGTYTKKVVVEAEGVNIYIIGDTNMTVEDAKVIDSSYSLKLNVLSNCTLTIVNKLDTSDSGYEDVSELKNAVSCDGDLTISGAGTINITSGKSGIKADGILSIFDTTINIIKAGYFFEDKIDTSVDDDSHAQGHALSASAIWLDSAKINITFCGKDGLHAELDDAVTEYKDDNGFIMQQVQQL